MPIPGLCVCLSASGPWPWVSAGGVCVCVCARGDRARLKPLLSVTAWGQSTAPHARPAESALQERRRLRREARLRAGGRRPTTPSPPPPQQWGLGCGPMSAWGRG